jgi:dTDP-glucose 4,6-dehydratase
VLHLAAESHVDRSILSGTPFVSTNVMGTQVLLEGTRRALEAAPRPFRFVNVSTDEVYGSLGPTEPAFTDASPLLPNSPYAASKAGADCLVRAYGRTFGLPCLTTRCSNNYGPFQFPEKFIPLLITRAIEDRPLPVYGDGLQVREWLHVEDHVDALWAVCTRGDPADEVYNIGGGASMPNVEVARTVLRLLEKPESLIRLVRDRPGHDRRYAVDARRLTTRLGWRPAQDFATGLRATVRWYLERRDWWAPVRGEASRAAEALYLAPEP